MNVEGVAWTQERVEDRNLVAENKHLFCFQLKEGALQPAQVGKEPGDWGGGKVASRMGNR